MSKLEKKSYLPSDYDEHSVSERLSRLEIGLTLLFLKDPKEDYDSGNFNNSLKILIEELEKGSYSPDSYGSNLSLLRNIHSRLTRPQRIANPVWALNIVAESLFRGRDPKNAPAGGHHLLPKLISKLLYAPGNERDRQLFESSLSIFVAAFEDILPYAHLASISPDVTGISPDTDKIMEYGRDILQWLNNIQSSNDIILNRPPALRYLEELLRLDSDFIKKFSEIFHDELESLKAYFEDKVKEMLDDKRDLEFIFQIDPETTQCRVLTLVPVLKIFLANLTIDPISKKETAHKSKIIVRSVKEGRAPQKILFRLLTNFAPLEETNLLTSKGENVTHEIANLSLFGVEFDERWRKPSQEEEKQGYTAAFELKVPSGYIPRRK